VYQTATVTQGNFSLTISATGPLQGGIYNINFSGSGIISELDVKVGQTVKQGQVLAILNKTSLQDAVNTAQATVMQDITAVNNSSSTSSATQTQSASSIASDQKAVTTAQTNLTQAQAQATANVSVAQTTLSNDQTNLSKTQAQSAADVKAAQTTLSNDQTNLSKTQAQQAAMVNAAQTTLDNDQAKLTQAQMQLAAANTTFTTDCTSSTNILCTSKVKNAVTTAKTNEATAQATVDADQSALKTAQATAKAANAAAQATVNADRQTVNTTEATANANNATARGTVDADRQAVTKAEADASASTATMQGDVTAAQNTLNNAVTLAGLNNTNAQGSVNTDQSTLQKDLTALQTAQHNLQNDILKAPHAGVVTTINGTVGGSPGVASASSVATTGSTFIQIVDLAALQVVANVNESDTANLKVGDPAQFTVSAYGERVFNGTVSAISPNGVTVSNVVTYPVTIDVATNDLRGASLLPGMTANVTLIVVQRPNVLLIPVSAVSFARLASTPSTTSGTPQLISSAQASVALDQARSTLRQLEIQNPDIGMDNPTAAFVLERSGQTFVAKPVVLGLTDGVVYEVLSGLTAGETLITGVQTQPGG